LAREDARDAAFEALKVELEEAMTRALAGHQSTVPGYTYSNGLKEVDTPAADAVQACLDNHGCAGALMLALRESNCPIVEAFRKLVVAQYINDTADTLADLRSE
jgi:hypothetical protein